jgi:hypothetical protein
MPHFPQKTREMGHPAVAARIRIRPSLQRSRKSARDARLNNLLKSKHTREFFSSRLAGRRAA